MSYLSVFRPDLFAGQVFVVTGAGSGIGRCTAHEIAALGGSVALVGRKTEKLQEVSAELAAEGVPVERISLHACDIRVEQQVCDMIDAVLAHHGKIDGLVNNAGGQYRQPLEEISSKGFEAVVRLNLFGGFMVMRECFNRWMKDHGGAIVNMISDMWGGWYHYGHSGAARGGMWTLSQTAAAEWASSGVRVNCVAPGGVASSGFDTYEPHVQEQILSYPPSVPARRYGNVAEVSAAIVYLLSPAAAYTTGDCIRVDGGAPNARCWDPPAPLKEGLDNDKSAMFEAFPLDEPPKILSEGISKTPRR